MSQATGVSTIPIAEIRENEAPQEIALLYEDMRRCMRLPVVNLVYRHLATMPGALHWVWGAVRPALLSGEVDDALDLLKRKLPLTEPAPLNPELLAEFNSADWLAIRRVLDAYNRGNGLNLIVLTTVRLALRRPEPVRPRAVFSGEPPTDAVPPLPPLLKIGDLDAETTSVVRDIARLHGGGPGIVPSIYLHLAHWPRFLVAVCDRIRPDLQSGTLNRMREAAIALARDAAERLLPLVAPTAPPPAQDLDRITAILEHFTSRVIPEMLPVGLEIEKALPH